MKLLAHRGYSAMYPENTMAAFIKAYEKGFDGIETDVHMTKDGELVLIHDETIDRTSNAQGYIRDQTLQQLRQYNFAYHHQGHHDIPCLRELLQFIKGKDWICNLELKTDVIHYPHIEEKVIALVEKIGVEKQIYYSSFDIATVLKMKQLRPQVYVGYLIEHCYALQYYRLQKYHIQAFHPHYRFLTQKRIACLKQQNIQIATWTVPDIYEYQRLKDEGVDIIISNDYLK